MSPDIRASIKKIVEYNYDEERTHYMEGPGDPDHIFVHIEKVRNWLKETKGNS